MSFHHPGELAVRTAIGQIGSHSFAQAPTRCKAQYGVGLVELLVSIVLLSMGFLAAARMQVEGMRFSQSAYHQSQAYFLANDLIDRMRSNIPGVTAGHYTHQVTRADAPDPRCDVVQCSPLGLARQDIHDWSASLYSMNGEINFVPALPSSAAYPASGEIVQVAPNVYAVVMQWNEVVGGKDTQQDLRIQFALETP